MKAIPLRGVIIFASIIVGVLGIVAFVGLKNSNQQQFESATVVLAFIDKEQIATASIAAKWKEAGIAVEFIDACKSSDESRNVACIIDHIQKISAVTKSLQAHLVVLGQKQYVPKLIQAFSSNDLTYELSALVLLQANIGASLNEETKVPKTLLISSSRDVATKVAARRRMAAKLRANDNWVWLTTLIADHANNLFSHPVLPEMINYLIGKREGTKYLNEFDAEAHWQQPIFNNDKFFAVNEAVQEYSVDQDLRRILSAFFSHEPYQLKQWPLEKYKSFDILKYRSHLSKEKQGRYVTFANRKGHKFYLDLDRYGRYQPEFVIAIDDETNLYKMSTFYKTKQYYSWEQGGPNVDMLYVQSLGAFIHFRVSVPQQYELPYLQYSSVVFESIEFTDKDPFADINNLTQSAFRVLTQNCIPCHSIDGVGGAAYHMDSRAGEPQPGFAQPLRTYSKEIYENFFYNQTATAALIGVNPNYVDRHIADELLQWLIEQK